MLNRHVLVLNQNYEPLSVCSVKRAVIMVFLDRAEIIETLDGQKIHSVSMSMSVPSVVRLDAYIKVPIKRIMLTRKNIIKRDGGRCQYCGKKGSQMTVDHVIPKNLGGKDSWENLVCACVKCNNKKGNQTPEEAGMTLSKKPQRPNYLFFIRYYIGKIDNRWKPYLYMK